MKIRHVTQQDNSLEISNIYETSWKCTYQNIIPQDYLDSIPIGKWADCIYKADMNHLVMIKDGRMIGTASFCKSRWEAHHDYGEIVSIYFLPEYIGQGYGKLLLDKCIEELKRCGFDKILLWVLEDNHRARRFYEKNGLICSEVFLNDTIGGKNLREVLYILV